MPPAIIASENPSAIPKHMIVGGVFFDLYAPTGKGEPTVAAHGSGMRWVGLALVGTARSTRGANACPSTPISLDRARLLPAITCSSSRAGDARMRCARSLPRITLTTARCAAETSYVDEVIALPLKTSSSAPTRGNAAPHARHRRAPRWHAPLMKESVEHLFARPS